MSTPANTGPKQVFINLPITDLSRSIAFYEGIGATRNPQFSDDTGACMVLSDTIFVMLLTHPKFSQFISKPIADAHKCCGLLLALSQDSREAVDALVAKVGAAGGRPDANPMQDHGFMYSRSFEDPDGHTWEPFWMDMEAATKAMAGGADAAS